MPLHHVRLPRHRNVHRRLGPGCRELEAVGPGDTSSSREAPPRMPRATRTSPTLRSASTASRHPRADRIDTSAGGVDARGSLRPGRTTRTPRKVLCHCRALSEPRLSRGFPVPGHNDGAWREALRTCHPPIRCPRRRAGSLRATCTPRTRLPNRACSGDSARPPVRSHRGRPDGTRRLARMPPEAPPSPGSLKTTPHRVATLRQGKQDDVETTRPSTDRGVDDEAAPAPEAAQRRAT